jgi:hypothetical protein
MPSFTYPRLFLVAALALAPAACSDDDSGSPGGAGGAVGTGGRGGSTGSGGAAGNQGTGGGTGGTPSGSGGSASGGSGGASADASGTEGETAGGGDTAPGNDGGTGLEGGAAAPPGCTLSWSPSAIVDGPKAFEFLELPDRNMIHPGADHLSVVADGNIYRFDSHYEQGGPIDFDRMLFTGPMRDDRLRGEVRGMVGPGGILEMKNGQTWRIHWALNVPATLKGTGRFTHIFQLKFVDTGGGLSGSPILTLSLSSPDNIQMRLWLGGPSFPVINLGPLHDRWLSSELVIKVGPGNSGTVRWIFKDGERTLHDSMVSGTTWPGNAVRVWPKWGIYRGITDGVRTTHMLTRDFRAYQCQ